MVSLGYGAEMGGGGGGVGERGSVLRGHTDIPHSVYCLLNSNAIVQTRYVFF